MGNWNDILNETKEAGTIHDAIRRKYLKKLYKKTGRNIILYYSGWLHKSDLNPTAASHVIINDLDKNGFMTVIHGMDRTKGLDLYLHTPGGDLAATESIINYLRAMFGEDIRAIVPQIAMSGGTLIACSCKEIIMGENSNIGPYDPQINGRPAQGIIEEFLRAASEMSQDQTKALLWQPILQKITPGFITHCERVRDLADIIAKQYLISGMFKNEPNPDTKAQAVIDNLGSNAATKIHNRHIGKEEAKNFGLKIADLEADNSLQDAVLSLHHACMITFQSTGAVKLIENQNGTAYIGSS